MSQVVTQSGALATPSFTAPNASLVIDHQKTAVVAFTGSTSLKSTAPGTSSDYLPYLYGSATKSDRINEPMLLDFVLVPVDGSFVKLTRGNYITFTNQTYPLYWFTGYITNEPELQLIGADKNRQPVFGYHYKATDDSYILNLKPVGILAPFTNMTCGAIIQNLVSILDPTGLFSCGNVQPGLRLARYVADPTKKFSEIVKELADMCNFRVRVQNHCITFAPKDSQSAGLVLDGSSQHFTPSQLSIQPSFDEVINDATVMGDIEPQNFMTEYYIGDGFAATYPMSSSIFGVDSALLLDDDFSGSLDQTKWNLFDNVGQHIQLANGFLNVIGGSANNTYDVFLQSANLIPLEGQIRMTHGEYDFVDSASAGVNGVIGGLWTGNPNATFNGCIYGIRVSKSGTTTTLNPIVNGVVDTTQSMTVDFSARYVLRTLASTPYTARLNQAFSFVDATGGVSSVGGTSTPALFTFKTWLIKLNTITGTVDSSFEWNNSAVLPGSTNYAYYTPVASNDLHCSLTGVTINTPLQASLAIKYKGTTYAPNTTYQIGSWVKPTVPNGFVYKVTGALPANATLIQSSGGTNTLKYVWDIGTSVNGVLYDVTVSVINLGTQPITVGSNFGSTGLIQPGAYQNVALQFVGNGTTDAQLQFFTNSVGDSLNVLAFNPSIAKDSDGINLIPAARQDFSSWTAFSGATVTVTQNQGASGIEPTWPTAVGSVVTSNVAFTAFLDDFNTQLIGPNEIDALDGTSPIATITDANSGVVQHSSFAGSSIYNASTASLAFFKNTANQVTYVPQVGDIVKLTYRRAAFAVARVQDPSSVSTEAAAWGDSGVRSIVRTNLSPLPRTSAECELAASALIQDNAYQHYEGTYTQLSPFEFNSEPQSGTVLKFVNMPSAFSPQLQAEAVTEVTSTFVHQSPNEYIQHQVKFGKIERLPTQLAIFARQDGVLAVTDSAEVPDAIAVGSVGNTFVSDVTAPTLVSVSSTSLNFNTNQVAPSGGGFEVRYTDDSWGADDAKNLVLRTSSQTFSVPRNSRGKFCFVKAYDGRNKILWSEDITQSVWTKASATVTNTTALDPDGNRATISIVSWTGTSGDINQTTSVACASAMACGSISVKGPAGNTVKLYLTDSATGATSIGIQTFTLTGRWQRISVSGTYGAGVSGNIQLVLVQNTPASAWSISVTRASVEVGTSSETIYCKTRSTPYGAMSRYAAGLHVAYPLIPPAPKATINGSNVLAPVINVVLPSSLSDVWGIEVRASDNATVLYHGDLSAAGYNPSVTVANLNLSVSDYVYTYNLLGEYSAPYNVQATLSPVGSNAIAAPGISYGKNLLINPSFELNTPNNGYVESSTLGTLPNGGAPANQILCDGWVNVGESQLDSNGHHWTQTVLSTGSLRSHGGSNCLLLRLAQTSSFVNNAAVTFTQTAGSAYLPVVAGKKYYFSAWSRIDNSNALPAGVTVQAVPTLSFYDANLNLISSQQVNRFAANADVNTGWIFGETGTFTMPSGVAYTRVLGTLSLNNASGSTFNTTTGTYADCAFDDFVFVEATDPATGEIVARGSIPPSLSTAFSYTATTTSITWSWTSMTILRADGTTTTPANGSFVVTGLTPGTTYKFFPYFDEVSGTIQFVTGFSGAGSPASAYTASTNTLSQQQNLQAHVALSSGPISAATPTSGTQTGSDGGSGICLWHRSLVQHRERGVVELGTCSVGDWILGRRGKWTQIVYMKKAPCDTWVDLELSNGGTLRCTPTHHFTLPDGSTKCAGDLTLSDFMFTCDIERQQFETISLPVSIRRAIAADTKVQITCEHEHDDDSCSTPCDDGHLFYAGTTEPNVLTHNVMLPRC